MCPIRFLSRRTPEATRAAQPSLLPESAEEFPRRRAQPGAADEPTGERQSSSATSPPAAKLRTPKGKPRRARPHSAAATFAVRAIWRRVIYYPTGDRGACAPASPEDTRREDTPYPRWNPSPGRPCDRRGGKGGKDGRSTVLSALARSRCHPDSTATPEFPLPMQP
jgi:hypothetical protein